MYGNLHILNLGVFLLKKKSYATLGLANFRCLLSSNLNSDFLYVSISSPPTRPRCLTVLSECRSSHNQSWDAECQFIFSYGLACCFNITCVRVESQTLTITV